MSEWTLLYQGVEKTLREWGLTDMIRERRATGEATITLGVDGRPIDAMDLFDFGQTVIVYRGRIKTGGVWGGGVRWFYGRVDPWEKSGGPDEEGHTGVLVNPWWYFREKNFEQIWKVFGGYVDPNDPTKGVNLIDFSMPHIFLGMLLQADLAHPNGKMSIGEQMGAVIDWLISEGAPIAKGTVGGGGLDSEFPVDEIRNGTTCEEVMGDLWRWCPNTVFLWDYTTLPYPTINCVQASTLTARDVALGKPITQVRLRERRDWLRPWVRIVYEQDNDGNLDKIEDFWPNPLPSEKFGGLRLVIPLIGTQSVKQQATVNATIIDETNLDWWRARFGWMNDESIRNLSIVSGSTSRGSLFLEDAYNPALIYETPDGSSFPNWLAAKYGVTAQRIRVSCKMTWIERAGSVPKDRVVEYECTATNGSGEYFDRTITQVGDPIPVALAKVIYDAIHDVPWDGVLTTEEAELSGLFDDWQRINILTDAQPTWATARALPQSIVEDARMGRTSVQFGAAQHLSANDLVELMRVTRKRLVLSITTRQGLALGATTVHLGKKTPSKNSGDGGGYYEKIVVSAVPDPDTNTGKGLLTQDATLKQFEMKAGSTEGTVRMRLHFNEEGTNKGQDIAFNDYDVCVIDPSTGQKTVMVATFLSSKPRAKT